MISLPICAQAIAPGAASDPGSAPARDTAVISGTVLDTNGSEVQGAHVVLKNTSDASQRVQSSNSDGEFTFSGLPAGAFKLAVSGAGWGTYVSPEIELHMGEFHLVRGIILPLSTSASIRVVASPEQLAEQQVQIAVQQRVLGVFPNFYSSYDWNAPPMGAPQKFHLALRSISDPTTFLGVAAIAGIEQRNNNFSSYGPGAQGYAKRYAAAYANLITGKMLSNAIFPSLFHQDPRYFYRGSGTARSRALYAISAAIITRSDNGHREVNYSRILGTFTAGGLSNLYYPSADRGVTLTLANGFVGIADDAGANLIREFLLKRFTHRGSEGLSAQP